MDRGSKLRERSAAGSAAPAHGFGPRPGRPQLALVRAPLRLGLPDKGVPAGWDEGLARLVDSFAPAAAFVPGAPERRRTRSAVPVPVFAPWQAWAPVAFQHGGLAILPQAHWVAGYLHEQGRGAAAVSGAVDLALLSPHPAACCAAEGGPPPLPRPAVLAAMLGAMQAEGRRRIALIVHARQRESISRLLEAQRARIARAGLAVSLLAIEEALVPLGEGGAGWDVIIAMPDLRGIVFTLLARAHGIAGPWPMLWHGGKGGGTLLRITSEAAVEGARPLPLDATALIQALALALDRSGARSAALRLHAAWARARAHGLATPSRAGDMPYVNAIADARFIALMGAPLPGGARPVQAWRALGAPASLAPGTHPAGLRVVISPLRAKAR